MLFRSSSLTNILPQISAPNLALSPSAGGRLRPESLAVGCAPKSLAYSILSFAPSAPKSLASSILSSAPSA